MSSLSRDEAIHVYRLLAFCARDRLEPALHRELAQKAERVTDWIGTPGEAEAHGLAPLLYTHLRSAGVVMPAPVLRALQGLYLRHRRASAVRMRVLTQILAAYQTEGIDALVLKGGALAHLVYSEPALRPMRDLDLLVAKSDAHRAQRVLADLGFQAPLPEDGSLPGKHFYAILEVEGLTISVETHHNLFDPGCSYSMGIESLTAEPLEFRLGPDGAPAYTLGHADMLWHLCQHMRANATVFDPTRLIWVADIVSFAEHFAAEIDWERIRAVYPLVLDVLSLFDSMTPLSEQLRASARLEIGDVPRGVGEEFSGWPRSSLAAQRAKGYARIVRESFVPSEWWLRMHYGLGSARPLFWYRWVRHPVEILGWAVHLLRERRVGFAPRLNGRYRTTLSSETQK